MGTQGVGTFQINSKFASGNLVFYEKTVGQTATGDVFTIGTTAVKVGGTSQDVDFQYYGTGSLSAIIDCGAATFTMVGITTSTNANIAITGTGKAVLGTSGVPLVLTVGSPIFTLYSTCATVHASNSAETFLVYNTMTGIAGVGGRARFYMTTNVALGAWSNALKAAVAYGASGRTTGLGSAFCAELEMSAGTSSGTYAPLESEIVLDTNAVCGTSTSFLFMSANGAAVATWRTNGDLFYIQGMGTASSTANVFHTTGTVSATHGLRINIDGVDYDILLKASTYA